MKVQKGSLKTFGDLLEKLLDLKYNKYVLVAIGANGHRNPPVSQSER